MKFEMFGNRLAKVFKHRNKQAKRLGISCYRLYDHDLPEFPFCIEWYGPDLYMAEYKRNHGMDDAAHDTWMEQSIEVLQEVLGIEKEHIFLKLRQRKPGRLGQYQRIDQLQNEFIVQENGLNFNINLSDYLDTGLFLDHRVTRQLVKENSAGKKVLNLFAYTGSFSVYAAAGGAAEVLTVDMSNTYLQWAQRNFTANNFPVTAEPFTGGNSFVQADVLQYLKTLPENYFDIIIMDPPTFSNSKRMLDILDIQRDHVGLLNDALKSLAPGGKIYFSTNARTFQLDEANIHTTKIKDITKATTPFDFEGKLFRWCYLLEK
jgi:23S rRNA (cytosine1962-C5)-methyltransferase